jgi:2-polyprenyl-3-methyl-5-hydroxy-6-metoxy-1,4-benzoquinol methylase
MTPPSANACIVCARPTNMKPLVAVSFGSLAKCASCGLVRVWPPRSAEQLASLHRTEEYFNHPYFKARRALDHANVAGKNRALLANALGKRATKGLKHLDIGCDTGALLVVSRDAFGMDVMGLEVSEHAAARAREAHGLNVRVGDLMTVDLPQFDLITLVDVIEHLSRPDQVLKRLESLLKPSGRIVIVTPNHDSLLNLIGTALGRVFPRLSLPLRDKLYVPYHEYYFTRSTLSQLAEGQGLTVDRLQLVEFPLDEIGHGLLLKLLLMPLFWLQALFGRQTLQELTVRKSEA